jgi:hypothetical protein
MSSDTPQVRSIVEVFQEAEIAGAISAGFSPQARRILVVGGSSESTSAAIA